MTNSMNAADKAAAAQHELLMARHRITALETSEAERAVSIHRVQREIGIAIAHERTGDVPALRAWIVEQQTAIDAEKAERKRLEGSLQQLIINAEALMRSASIVRTNARTDELTAARTAWADAITPHLAAAERLRAAVKAAGLYCLLPSDADLLSGGGNRPINV